MTTLKAKGCTFAEFLPLRAAEWRLWGCCQRGEPAEIAKVRPGKNDNNRSNTVRAEFVRFLALGGDDDAPVHEHGVHLHGAWIEGELQMRSAEVSSDFYLTACHFSHAPVFHNAKIDGTLGLDGSSVLSLDGNGLVCEGGLFLRNGFTAIGAVDLVGAQIGGNLDCSKAIFKGDVKRHQDGEKRYTLCAQSVEVDGIFFFRELNPSVDDISLTACHVRVLADDLKSWGNRLLLDGFTYGSIAKNSPTGAAKRLKWLGRQSPRDSGLRGRGVAFKPQPWRQLIKVLREMGHAEESRQVGIAFEDRLREAKLVGRTPETWWGPLRWIFRAFSIAVHWALGKFTGYGHRPQFLFFWMLGIWLACALFYWHAAENGVFAPSAPAVFQNGKCVSSASTPCLPEKIGNWYLSDKLPEAYPRLQPLMYSLDVLLPPVNLQQSNNWGPESSAPDTENEWYMHVQAQNVLKGATRWVVWLEILFGWLSTALFVAMVSGVMKRRED